MIKNAIVASLMLAGTPALAQTAQTTAPAGPPTTVPTPPSADQGTTTTTDSTATSSEPAAGTTSTTGTTADPSATGTGTTVATDAQSTASADTTDQVAATVEADWAKYDVNKNDRLSRTELNKWLTDLQSAAGQKAPGKSYLAAAFQKADTDKSKSVSKEELTAFLKG